jgi:hypothetical protein
MNPVISQDLAAQHARDLQIQAAAARRGRKVRRAARAARAAVGHLAGTP